MFSYFDQHRKFVYSYFIILDSNGIFVSVWQVKELLYNNLNLLLRWIMIRICVFSGPRPGPPRNVTVTEIPNGFLITWEHPSDRAHLTSHFTIKYRTDAQWRTLNKGTIRPEETQYLGMNIFVFWLGKTKERKNAIIRSTSLISYAHQNSGLVNSGWSAVLRDNLMTVNLQKSAIRSTFAISTTFLNVYQWPNRA